MRRWLARVAEAYEIPYRASVGTWLHRRRRRPDQPPACAQARSIPCATSISSQMVDYDDACRIACGCWSTG
ncbi:MAG: hypothetical protein R2856_31340 [Caldilineaceae bacterium]